MELIESFKDIILKQGGLSEVTGTEVEDNTGTDFDKPGEDRPEYSETQDLFGTQAPAMGDR